MQEVKIVLATDKGTRMKAGRYAYILECAGKEVAGSGQDRGTTRNRLGLLALTHALKRMTRPAAITVITDNSYLVGAHARLHEWERAGWKGSKGGIANVDLWEEVLASQKMHAIRITKGDPETYGLNLDKAHKY